nr:MAG TPA: hypothetical protein [Caudoviricetes sp.]
MKKILILVFGVFIFNFSFSYEILSDKINEDVREIEVEYSKEESDKYTETAEHLMKEYNYPKEIGYYEYPLEIVTDILKEDVKKNIKVNYLVILIREKDIKEPLMRVTIVKDEYIPLGKDINKLNGRIFWKNYKDYGNKIGLSIGMQPDTRKLYEQLFN